VTEAPRQTAAIGSFVTALAAWCPTIRAVWCVGERADAHEEHDTEHLPWDLVAFANRYVLFRLRTTTSLHRLDVRLRVVIDGDQLRAAWGGGPDGGSLMQWEWMETGGGEAFYSEARWALPLSGRLVERVRRRALCVWRQPASPSRRAMEALSGGKRW
jgi:hypothetical protein